MEFQLSSREWHYMLPDGKSRIAILHVTQNDSYHVSREIWDDYTGGFIQPGLAFHYVGPDAYERAFACAAVLWHRAAAEEKAA